tara:strand:+ start:568 stop:1440 length:873 start_codon:yes stop_codon:yes gene_type:complete
MKRFISIAILSLVIDIQFIQLAQAVPGGIFRNIFKIFKGSTDDVMKNSGKMDEVLSGMKKKSVNESIAGPTQESLIMEKVGANSHLTELNSLKSSTRAGYIKKLKKQKFKLEGEDEALEYIFDEKSSSSSSTTTPNNNLFEKYIIINWIGRVYNNSDYFSKPKKEKKMLLICSNVDQVFYFSLWMEEEPKRAFLIKNIKLNNSKSRNSMSTKTLPIQELIIIEDKDNVKIMVTRPKDQWPENYFIIYDDQNFYYDRAYSGNVTPEDIRNKISQNPKGKNNCSKATNEGLL